MTVERGSIFYLRLPVLCIYSVQFPSNATENYGQLTHQLPITNSLSVYSLQITSKKLISNFHPKIQHPHPKIQEAAKTPLTKILLAKYCVNIIIWTMMYSLLYLIRNSLVV